MAENESGQEKTEQATPRRLQKARDEGQVPKSMELNTTMILISGVVAFYYFADDLYEGIMESIIYYFQQSAYLNITEESIQMLTWEIGLRVLTILAPFFLIFMVVALVINVAQVGFILVPTALQPKFNKINPISGLKNLFSMRGRVQFIKAVLKMFVIAPVMVYTVYKGLPDTMAMIDMDIKDIIIFIGYQSLDLAIKALIIMFILAILDFTYQRWQQSQDLKMSKEEVRQEMKDVQGDPKIKQRIRSIQMEMSRRRMMEKVPEAEVVVTNPTEYAVALKYDSAEHPAPIVLAKGRNLIARRIKEIAKEHNIPIVENRPLAQSLYKLVGVGNMIPPDLYQAVAEVLAYVYKLTRKVNTEG
ncbi:MAG: flagellar biosynthesis protein FlhB [bacterium]|jgi:flagellar biosynthetic protein FlhB|nr:flagellar biosynthesis protein FlhB [bacterium]